MLVFERPNLKVFQDDNLEFLKAMPTNSDVKLIYVDPPYGTQKQMNYTRMKVSQDIDGLRVGFGEKTYTTKEISKMSYNDFFDDFMEFLGPRLQEAYRVLHPQGSFFLHLDYRNIHYAKLVMDRIFGKENFINEIIWAYDYGGKPKNKWACKHDNILWYAKDAENYTFNYDMIDRIPYMAPGLCGAEKAERGKVPTDCWWNTIVPTNGKERTGYPTQKPLGILNRIIQVHSYPGDLTMDFFAGSGSFGEAAIKNGRNSILVDQNPEAIEVMRKRFIEDDPNFVALS